MFYKKKVNHLQLYDFVVFVKTYKKKHKSEWQGRKIEYEYEIPEGEIAFVSKIVFRNYNYDDIEEVVLIFSSEYVAKAKQKGTRAVVTCWETINKPKCGKTISAHFVPDTLRKDILKTYSLYYDIPDHLEQFM